MCPNCNSRNVICVNRADTDASKVCVKHKCNDCNNVHDPVPAMHGPHD